MVFLFFQYYIIVFMLFGCILLFLDYLGLYYYFCVFLFCIGVFGFSLILVFLSFKRCIHVFGCFTRFSNFIKKYKFLLLIPITRKK